MPNPTHPSCLAEKDKMHSKATSTLNNNLSYPASDGLRLVAPDPNTIPPPYQNQEALQQLQNNLRLVLKQQQPQQRNPPKSFPKYQQPQGLIVLPGPQHGPKDVGVDHDTIIPHSSERPCSTSGTSPVAFQTKPLPSYPISSNNSTAPSLTEERSGSSNMDDNISNSNASKQQKRHYQPAPQSYSLQQLQSKSQSLSPHPPPSNTSSKLLYALGDDFQPLLSQSQQKDIRPSSKLSSTNNALIGSWSEEMTSQEVANDIFMDNLFHAELKLSRQSKNSDKDSKPKPPSDTSNSNQQQNFHSSSKMDAELEVSDIEKISFQVCWIFH